MTYTNGNRLKLLHDPLTNGTGSDERSASAILSTQQDESCAPQAARRTQPEGFKDHLPATRVYWAPCDQGKAAHPAIINTKHCRCSHVDSPETGTGCSKRRRASASHHCSWMSADLPRGFNNGERIHLATAATYDT